MTVNEWKKENPGKMFYLKGTRGHVFSPMAYDALIPQVYESEITSIGTMKIAKVPCLRINYDFLKVN